MNWRYVVAAVAVSTLGALASAIAIAHALYLGFDLAYFFPVALAGVLSVAITLALSRTGSLRAFFSSPSRILLLIVGIGAVMRLVMMFNPNGTEDEWKYVFIVAQNNPLDLGFVRNFNQIGSALSSETTPLPFVLMKLGYLASPSLQGTRIVSVVMNILLVPIAYLLAKEFTSERVAQLTAFLFAINPASLYFFDAADTDVYVFFFCMLGLLLFVRGYRHGSFKLVILGGLAFGLAYWSKAAFPDSWIGIAVILALLVPSDVSGPRKLSMIILLILVPVGAFLPWGVADPQSYNGILFGLPRQVLGSLTAGDIQLGGSGTVVGSGSSGLAVTAVNSFLLGLTAAILASPLAWAAFQALKEYGRETKLFLSALLGTVGLILIWSLVPPSSVGQVPSEIWNALQFRWVLPLFQAGSGTYTSFFDVIAQVPLWFGPVTVLFGFFVLAYGLLGKNKRGLYLAMLLWVLAIIVPLLSQNRDVRYFFDVATFPVVFLAAEVAGVKSKRFGRALEVILVLFAVLFLVLGAFVGFQYTSGVTEASNFVNRNYSHPSALIDYGGFASMLNPGGTINYLPSDAKTLSSNLSQTKYDVVMIWYQARTIGYPAQLVSTLNHYYLHTAVFGLSNFSYVVVYYGYNGTG